MFNLFGSKRQYPGEKTFVGDSEKFPGDKTPFVHAQSFLQSCISGGYHVYVPGMDESGKDDRRVYDANTLTPALFGLSIVSIRNPRTGQPYAFCGLVGDDSGHSLKLAIYNDTPAARDLRGSIDLQERLKHTSSAFKLSPAGQRRPQTPAPIVPPRQQPAPKAAAPRPQANPADWRKQPNPFA